MFRGEALDGLELFDAERHASRALWGGILRAGVPDFGRYAESYAGDRAFLEERRPGRPTPLLALADRGGKLGLPEARVAMVRK